MRGRTCPHGRAPLRLRVRAFGRDAIGAVSVSPPASRIRKSAAIHPRLLLRRLSSSTVASAIPCAGRRQPVPRSRSSTPLPSPECREGSRAAIAASAWTKLLPFVVAPPPPRRPQTLPLPPLPPLPFGWSRHRRHRFQVPSLPSPPPAVKCVDDLCGTVAALPHTTRLVALPCSPPPPPPPPSQPDCRDRP